MSTSIILLPTLDGLKIRVRLYGWIHYLEKMLYDNALLVRAYLHAWQVTKEPACGFYSSLDADSDFFEAAYGISPTGNWEGKTVLHRMLDDASLAARFKLDLETVPVKLAESHARLYTVRASRTPNRPAINNKILTAWNGLTLAAFAEAARVLADSSPQSDLQTNTQSNYLILATRNAEFLLSSLRPNGKLCRAWRDGETTSEVFLEDYASLILRLIELYQTDFNNKWFTSARELTDEMIEKFSDPNGGFFDTPHDGEALLIRPKDISDNATPSHNALACEVLLKLAAYTDNGKYRDLAEQALALMGDSALRIPLGFARWLSAAENAQGNTKQVAVMGEAGEENFERMLKIIRAEYRPGVVAASPYSPSKNAPALLKDRPLVNGKATAYVCEGFVCKQPTTDLEIFKAQMNA